MGRDVEMGKDNDGEINHRIALRAIVLRTSPDTSGGCNLVVVVLVLSFASMETPVDSVFWNHLLG